MKNKILKLLFKKCGAMPIFTMDINNKVND